MFVFVRASKLDHSTCLMLVGGQEEEKEGGGVDRHWDKQPHQVCSGIIDYFDRSMSSSMLKHINEPPPSPHTHTRRLYPLLYILYEGEMLGIGR